MRQQSRFMVTQHMMNGTGWKLGSDTTSTLSHIAKLTTSNRPSLCLAVVSLRHRAALIHTWWCSSAP